jgi:hypothetical protein
VSTDWDNYTDEEFLSLPFDTPAVCGEYGQKYLSKRARSALFPLRIYLLRDILVFRRESPSQQKLQIRNTEEGQALLRRRMIWRDPSLASNAAYHFRAADDNHQFKKVKSAFGEVRTAWNKYIWPQAPPKFRERLNRIPNPPLSFVSMQQGSNIDFDVTSLIDLILWKKLTLEGVLCEDYSVRRR